MTDLRPIACSLGAGDLRRRLDEIAELGAAGLIGHGTAEGKHTLRFHPDPTTRRRLEEIVVAEGECCSFLDLKLTEHRGELILTLAAPEDGQLIADELKAAFVGHSNKR